MGILRQRKLVEKIVRSRWKSKKSMAKILNTKESGMVSFLNTIKVMGRLLSQFARQPVFGWIHMDWRRSGNSSLTLHDPEISPGPMQDRDKIKWCLEIHQNYIKLLIPIKLIRWLGWSKSFVCKTYFRILGEYITCFYYGVMQTLSTIVWIRMIATPGLRLQEIYQLWF